MRDRGHKVTIATSEIYRAKIEGEGLRFRPLRPDFNFVLEDPDIIRRAFHPRTGGAYILRKLLIPWIEQSYEDTLAAARDADFLVGHAITFATRTVAEVLQKPWMSVALQPSIFLSAYDPSSIPGAPFLDRLHPLGPRFWGPAYRLIRHAARRWGRPLNALRGKAGLLPLNNALLDGMFSPTGTQAWFSKVLAEPQPDWQPRTTVTGFPFYDKLEPGQCLTPELERFLADGPAPVVFTLGSAAVMDAGEFYAESLLAVRRLGCRAVMLIGRDARNLPVGPVPDTVHFAEYAPYSELLSRAAAVVHQGGVGTTAQSLRAGKPMLVVPMSHDQPDNGRRIAKLGVGAVIPRSKYRAESAAAALQQLTAAQSYRDAATRIAQVIAGEDGVSAACDGLEAALQAVTKSGA